MSSQYESWFFVRDGNVYYHYENDGYQAMRRGLEATNTLLGTVDNVEWILRNAGKVRKAIEEDKKDVG
jgi:hypothetical protein